MNNILYTFLTYLKTSSILFMLDILCFTVCGNYSFRTIEAIQGEPIQARLVITPIVYTFTSYMLLQTKSAKEAFLYGICIYGIHEFTSYSLFIRYDWKLMIGNTLWAGVLFVIAGYLLQLWN